MKKILLVLFLLCLSNPALATNWCGSSSGCVACYLMEDDGNESNRCVNGSTALTETGGDIPQDADAKFGTYSRDFEDSDSEYLVHGDGNETDISGADQSITVCGWAKMEDDLNHIYAVAGKYDYGSNNRQYILRLDTANNKMSFGVSGDGVTLNSTAGDTATLVIDTWYFLCGVYNDSTIEVYLDGSNDSTSPTSYSGGIYDGTSGFAVGTYFDTYPTPRFYYDGLIDDVGVFDVALDSTDINDIMDNGLSGTPPQIF